MSVKIEYGNHEELYELLCTGAVDLVLNDQRRAFSDQYVNLVLAVGNEYIEISSRNPIASLPKITRNYCAFWKQENSSYYVEEFAEILKRKFE